MSNSQASRDFFVNAHKNEQHIVLQLFWGEACISSGNNSV